MIEVVLKKIRNKWYIASGSIGFPTTIRQNDCFSKYIKENENLTITKDVVKGSFCKIVPEDTGEDYLCKMYDVESNEFIGTVNICYDFFTKFKIDGEFYFNRITD